MRKPSPAMLVALAALFVALGGVGIAADGQSLILGKSDNSAAHKTGLTAPVNDKALQLTNTSTGTSATALGLTVASGHAPFTVNSQTRVANLNADKLDGVDSGGFLRSHGDIQLWYSPYDYVADNVTGYGQTYVNAGPGPVVHVARASAGSTAVLLPLDQPQNVFGTTLKLKAVTICYQSPFAVIVATSLEYGEKSDQATKVYEDFYVRSSAEPTCYEAALTTPTVISGSLYLRLGLYFDDTFGAEMVLYSVRTTLGT
jgi:hypothetical protein